MNIQVEDHGKVCIISPQGDISVGEGDVALRESVQVQTERGCSRIVLNLEGVRYMDSAGIGELVACLKRVREAGGDLKVCSVNQRVSDAFHALQLVKILGIYKDSEEAIASFV